MGVAGVAIVYGFISFVKLIGAFFKWNSWKSKGVSCPAVVVGVIDTKENYKNKKGATHYRYNVAVDYRGKQPMTIYPMAVFEKTVYPNSKNKVAVGQELRLLYDPQTSTCADAAELTSAIKDYLLTLIFCIVIFVICMLIAGAIS